jgi:hypothetical protein
MRIYNVCSEYYSKTEQISNYGSYRVAAQSHEEAIAKAKKKMGFNERVEQVILLASED